MKLLQRLKNIWKLSELQPMKIGEKLVVGDVVTTLKNVGFLQRENKRKMSAIIE